MPRPLPDRFQVAFSFAGEQRDLVRSVAQAVEHRLGEGTVFFDEWYEHYLAGHDADLKLQEIYTERTVLTVVCISERYGNKPWTRMEHEAVRAQVMKLRASDHEQDQFRILPLRVGDGEVKGISFNTISPDIRHRNPDETADLIVSRLSLIQADVNQENIQTSGPLSNRSPNTQIHSMPPTQPAEPSTMAFSGKTKIAFCNRLGGDWKALADILEIPPIEQNRFTPGDEGRQIWVWLENRKRLLELPASLVDIDRPDLAELFIKANPDE